MTKNSEMTSQLRTSSVIGPGDNDTVDCFRGKRQGHHRSGKRNGTTVTETDTLREGPEVLEALSFLTQST